MVNRYKVLVDKICKHLVILWESLFKFSRMIVSHNFVTDIIGNWSQIGYLDLTTTLTG